MAPFSPPSFQHYSQCWAVAGTAFEAAIGATSGTLLWFVVAMIVYPDTMRRAQKEIDELLGDEGDMPSVQHMDDLPYCVALMKEVRSLFSLQIQPCTALTEDDCLKGHEMDAGYPWLILPLLRRGRRVQRLSYIEEYVNHPASVGYSSR